MGTHMTKKNEITRTWYVIDAEGKTLGRLCSEVARLLIGKHKPYYVPYLDTGDFVIVVNAKKVAIPEAKLKTKIYYRHSGYPGGIKAITAEKLLSKHPERIIWIAVKGMLPKNRMGHKLIHKLKIYADGVHPHQAQNPLPFTL